MMKKLILSITLTGLLAGCTAMTGDKGLPRAERSADERAYADFQTDFERLVAYAGVIGRKINEPRLAGITRYEMDVSGSDRQGSLVRYDARCPVLFVVDNLGTVIKPQFADEITTDEIADCGLILEDYRTFVRTGKTIPERRKEARDKLLAEALKYEGTPQYYSLLRQAADLGSVEAQVEVGTAFWTGTIVEEDRQEAIKYLTKAAEAGEPNAQYILGKHYFSLGTADDMATAYALFKASAEKKPDGKASVYWAAMSNQLSKNDRGLAIMKKGEERFAELMK